MKNKNGNGSTLLINGLFNYEFIYTVSIEKMGEFIINYACSCTSKLSNSTDKFCACDMGKL